MFESFVYLTLANMFKAFAFCSKSCGLYALTFTKKKKLLAFVIVV